VVVLEFCDTGLSWGTLVHEVNKRPMARTRRAGIKSVFISGKVNQ
jgi:hypothetical protein